MNTDDYVIWFTVGEDLGHPAFHLRWFTYGERWKVFHRKDAPSVH